VVSAVLPLKESSRELIVDISRALEPYFPDVTTTWRELLIKEFRFDARVLAALERLNIGTGVGYFRHGDFQGFFENVSYFATRLAKLGVDTRAVARSLELYHFLCEPYLGGFFEELSSEARAALDSLSSATFVTLSGAYFDSKSAESRALLAVLEAELTAPDLSALLQQVLKITTETFAASMGAILLCESEGEPMRVRCAIGLDDDPELQIELGQGFSGHIAQTGEPELLSDAGRDERVLSPTLRKYAKAVWGVPLKNEGSSIGVLVIGFSKPYEWMPTERELMRAIADRSALAIERARITDALREREMRIADLSAHLLRVQEEERKRISRELHDETGQGLMVIRLYLGMLESSVSSAAARGKIRETLAVVDRTIEGIRRIIGKLSPLVLQELGLIAAIRKEAKDLAKATGVKARVAVSDAVGRLAPETEAAIYRVVQEALHNVAKHAQAKSVNIQMGRDNGGVKLLIEDDGVGIISQRTSARGSSYGLVGIKERVAMLGGTLRIHSSRNKGTKIEVTVPAADMPAELAERPMAQGGVNA
jgi:signal transduction histidine kinase